MIRPGCLAAALAFGLTWPAAAQDASPAFDYAERTRALAFDPARFFAEHRPPVMSIRYMGDDYDYPVYAVAVRRGCTAADQGEGRRTCGGRLTARMVRAPYEGEPPRPRTRGQMLFATLAKAQPKGDEALLGLLDAAGLEWLEADVGECPGAMAHLATGQDLTFSPTLDQIGQPDPWGEIVLHADKVTFETGDYLMRSRYEGWLKPGSAGAWANALAASLEPCWHPSAAAVPWRMVKE